MERNGNIGSSKHLSPVWPQATGLQVLRGHGAWLFTAARPYLDFTSGIAVTSTGHCHPKVVKAIQEQAGLLLHGQVTIVMQRPVATLAEELAALVPERLGCFFFANSGSEAVESAVKLARHATGRPNVIAFRGGYHGRTLGALSLTSAKSVYRSGYQPLRSGSFFAPFPNPIGRDSGEAAATRCIEELRWLLDTVSTPEETAAMIVEPVLGEGGYVVPPRSFLHALRELCDETGILMILDEVQTGFGRTGRMFACEHFGIWPDILVMAKGLGSGMPISGIAASAELMAAWRQGSHGGTYGGNPVCAAAASATIRVLQEEGLVANAARQGELLSSRLGALRTDSPGLSDVRGLGLMVGCEFTGKDGGPDPREARRVCEHCLSNGLILSTCGTYDHVIRWVPPLTVTASEIEAAIDTFAAALDRATPAGKKALGLERQLIPDPGEERGR